MCHSPSFHKRNYSFFNINAKTMGDVHYGNAFYFFFYVSGASMSTVKYETSPNVNSPDGLYYECVCRSSIIGGQGIIVEYKIVFACLYTLTFLYFFGYTHAYTYSLSRD